MSAQPQVITLIGAGLNGPLLGLELVKRGFRVDIYERRPDMRQVHQSAGRSINLALSTRGIHALTEAGLWGGMRDIVIPMKGRMIHAVNSQVTFQPYGKDESEVIHAISRAALNIALLNAAERQGVRIHFQQRCTGFDFGTGAVRLNDENDAERSVESGAVIACDGSGSAIRNDMRKLEGFHDSQQYLDYGYKELTIPAGPGGKHAMDRGGLHIWPRGNYMLIALPNTDGTFGCILFLPFEGRDSFAELNSPSAVAAFFQARFPDAFSLMPDLVPNFFSNPVGSMATVKCSPWHVKGRLLLLGDAAHAIVPFFGQGINCGFEDCTTLLELIDRCGPDLPRVFSEFEAARKVNTDAIADMAVENFVEMRDRVADPSFLLRKKVELALEAKFPGVFVPKYAMVTFHRIPYSVAMRRGAKQERILQELGEGIQSVEDLDWQKAEQLIRSELTPLEFLS